MSSWKKGRPERPGRDRRLSNCWSGALYVLAEKGCPGATLEWAEKNVVIRVLYWGVANSTLGSGSGASPVGSAEKAMWE